MTTRRRRDATWRYCPDCGKRYERDDETRAGDYCQRCRGEVEPAREWWRGASEGGIDSSVDRRYMNGGGE